MARPFVCGAIGDWDETVLGRLRASAPIAVRLVHRSVRAALWSSGTVPSWRAESFGWLWWPVADGPPPRSWVEAADDRGAAGLAIDGDSAIVHTCGLGLQELYIRRLRDALYFATRIEPLLGIDDCLLHTDWQAWASIVALGGPMGDETPFREVRRVPWATAWRADASGIRSVRFEPRWLRAEPSATQGVDEIARVLGGHVPVGRWGRPVNVTLSGGWDSRLLAAIAVAGRRSRAPVGWTTSPDDGYDEDVSMSRPVASALGLRHRLVIPGDDEWRAERSVVLERVQHQTCLHPWLMPLARQLHRRRTPVLDGLMGDVLLRNHFVDDAAIEAPSEGARRHAIWNKISAGILAQNDTFGSGVAARLEDASREAFERAVSAIPEHPAGATISVFLTRTARAITPAPMCLFAPEVDVRMPFAHPDVVAATLMVPIRAKFGGGFYRELIAAVGGPAVAQLPSTNDGRPHPEAGSRRQTRPAALADIVEPIAADDTVRALLGPRLLRTLDDPAERVRVGWFNGARAVLMWAGMLADWRRKYASRLVAE